LVGNPQGKDHPGKINISGRIILKWVLGNWDMTMWMDSPDSE
jgi:hypothetical protein